MTGLTAEPDVMDIDESTGGRPGDDPDVDYASEPSDIVLTGKVSLESMNITYPLWCGMDD
jgi:hypothetical protein